MVEAFKSVHSCVIVCPFVWSLDCAPVAAILIYMYKVVGGKNLRFLQYYSPTNPNRFIVNLCPYFLTLITRDLGF